MLSVLPLGLGGGSAQAMTCVAEPPIDTACDVVFTVLRTVCTGAPPTLPNLPGIAGAAAVGWPIECPVLG